MRKVVPSLFAVLGLMVLMVPLAHGTILPNEPTSLEVWLEFDSIDAEPYDGGILLILDLRVCIMNVGEHVAHIGEVQDTIEIKEKHEDWAWVLMAWTLADLFIDPGQTEEVRFVWGGSISIPKAFRSVAEVELLNHPTGVHWFHYTESFEVPMVTIDG